MGLTDSDKREMLRLLMATRRIEEVMTEHAGGYHQAVGQEAVIVGAFFGLGEGDIASPHFRGTVPSGYVRGADVRKLIAGVLGKVTGYGRGRWRGDMYAPPEFGMLGMWSGILGTNVNNGTGAALALKYKGGQNVTVATFGDGSSNEGAIHEAMNLAACYDLPVVYICHNNQWAITTPIHKACKAKSIADRAVGYGIPGEQVDGNDVLAVYESVAKAIQRARSGQGPTLIDALTYRVEGHFNLDDGAYQPRDEVEAWKKRDPITVLSSKLIESGLMTGAEIEDMRTKANTEIEQALETALNDPDPDWEAMAPFTGFAPDPKQGDK